MNFDKEEIRKPRFLVWSLEIEAFLFLFTFSIVADIFLFLRKDRKFLLLFFCLYNIKLTVLFFIGTKFLLKNFYLLSSSF